MKLRVFVTPQKHVLDSELAGILQSLENRNALEISGAKIEKRLEFALVGGDAAPIESAVRDLNTVLAGVTCAGTAIRWENVVDETPASMAAPAGAAQAELSPIADLDGAGVQQTLPDLLSTPTTVDRFRRGRSSTAEFRANGDNESAIVRIQTPDAESLVAMSAARPARFGGAAAHPGGQIAIAEALRELACRGAVPRAIGVQLAIHDPVAVSDLLQLRDYLRATAEACDVFGLCLSGVRVEAAKGGSSHGGAPFSTAAIGTVADERHLARVSVSAAGQQFVLLGEAPHELGGSHFLAVKHGRQDGEPPAIDLAAEKRLNKTMLALIKGGVVAAARPVAAGGLLVAASELLFAPDRELGAKLDVTPLGGARTDALLFGESQGRAIVVVAAERVGTVLSEAHMRGVPAVLIGEVTDGPALSLKARSLATEWPVAELRRQRAGAGQGGTKR